MQLEIDPYAALTRLLYHREPYKKLDMIDDEANPRDRWIHVDKRQNIYLTHRFRKIITNWIG